jgi:hypothetical protein
VYVYSNNTVDAAVDSFTNVILQAMDLAFRLGFIGKSRSPHRFSHKLIYYIRKKIIFIGDTRKARRVLL